MLLGNADIEIAVRKTALKLHHARTLAHGWRDANQTGVGQGHVAQPLPKHLGKGLLGWRAGALKANRWVKFARTVVGHRVSFGELITLALFGHHMQKLRSGQLLDVFQRGDQGIEIMAVDRADVVEAEFLKQRGGHHHTLGLLLKALGQFQQGWGALEDVDTNTFGSCVKAPAHELGQVAVERADRRADAHVVVVEHHQQAAVGHAGVVEGLKRHAGGERAVANDGHRVSVITLDASRHRHAQRGRDRGAGVGRAEGVVIALHALRKAAQAAPLPQGAHALTPASENFVRVGLVAYVPHQTVLGGVEHIVQCDGEFDRAQIRTEVPAGLGHTAQQKGTQFDGELPQLGARQAP